MLASFLIFDAVILTFFCLSVAIDRLNFGCSNPDSFFGPLFGFFVVVFDHIMNG